MKNAGSIVILFVLIQYLLSCSTGVPVVQQQPLSQTLKDPNELLLDHKYFVISYDEDRNIAKWVKYNLTKKDLDGPGIRKDNFKKDPLLVEKGLHAIKPTDYAKTGYARGHLAPAEDFDRSQDAIDSTFIMSNMIPQKGSINSGRWRKLEATVHGWACGEESITVYTGPVIESGLPRLPVGMIIPKEFFKVVIDNTEPKKAIGFVYNQVDKDQTTENRQIPVNRIEEIVGEKFSNNVPDSKVSDWAFCTVGKGKSNGRK